MITLTAVVLQTFLHFKSGGKLKQSNCIALFSTFRKKLRTKKNHNSRNNSMQKLKIWANFSENVFVKLNFSNKHPSLGCFYYQKVETYLCKCTGYLQTMLLFDMKIDATVKMLKVFLNLSNLLIFASTPSTFWSPTPRGRRI